MKEAQQDVEEIASDAPEEVKAILTNMAFNLGKRGLKGFRKMLAAIKLGDWGTAANEMENSKWFNQVGDRSKRLVERMRNVNAKPN